MTFNIYVRSYNRYDKIVTQPLLEYCTYVVRESQAQLYRDAGVKNVWGVKDELVNSGAKVLNFLIENAPEDVIAVIDDDTTGFKYRLDKFEPITDPAIATAEIERLAQLVVDLDLGFGSGVGHTNLLYYDRPFKVCGVNNGLKIFNRKKVVGRFNGDYRFLYDDDFQMQELLTNRIVLLSMYFLHNSIVDTNKGGNNDDKSGKEFNSDHDRMKEKWGKYYQKPEGGQSGRLVVKR